MADLMMFTGGAEVGGANIYRKYKLDENHFCWVSQNLFVEWTTFTVII